jgi:lysophospholipase L1-like esterase
MFQHTRSLWAFQRVSVVAENEVALMSGQFIFLTLIAIIVAFECFLRVRYFLRTKKFSLYARDPSGKATFFKEHPYCFYVKRENSEGIYPSNSHGHVGKVEPIAHKSKNTVRLYFVGGSTTEEIDSSLGPDSHWPAIYTHKLNRYYPDRSFECINAACSGYTSAESLSEFLYRGLDFRPDYLFIYHNVNDAWTVQMRKEFKPDYSLARIVGSLKRPFFASIPQIPLSYLYQALRRKLMAGYVHRGLMNYISDPPWSPGERFDETRGEPFKRNIVNLVNISRLWDCTPILINWEYAEAIPFETSLYIGQPAVYSELYNRYVDLNNETLKDVANQYGVTHFTLGPFVDNLFQADGMHLNARGREEFSERLFEKSKDMFNLASRKIDSSIKK